MIDYENYETDCKIYKIVWKGIYQPKQATRTKSQTAIFGNLREELRSLLGQTGTGIWQKGKL
jgi:hypothetical protein